MNLIERLSRRYAVHPAAHALSAALALTACEAEPEPELETTSGETILEETNQDLATYRGTGGVWLPPAGQVVTPIYWCVEDPLPANIDALEVYVGISSIDQGLTESWEAAANINFIGEGACSAAAHASQAIRVRIGSTTESGWGRAMAGRVNGMTLKLDTALVSTHCGASIDYVTCVKHQAIHEFGHALGFGHESARSDRTATCPNGNPAGTLAPDELITDYDPDSILETSYCRVVNSSTALSTRDISGARAVYGSGDNFCNAPRACIHQKYDAQVAVRFSNGRFLQPRDDGGVETQDFVGTWERVRFRKISGSSGSNIRYGDIVSIQDRWGNFLRGRDDNEVDKQTYAGVWEEWEVVSPNSSLYSGSVLTNGPVRLRNRRFGKYLYLRGGSDVELTSSTSGTELRFLGPYKEL